MFVSLPSSYFETLPQHSEKMAAVGEKVGHEDFSLLHGSVGWPRATRSFSQVGTAKRVALANSPNLLVSSLFSGSYICLIVSFIVSLFLMLTWKIICGPPQGKDDSALTFDSATLLGLKNNNNNNKTQLP
jgi:hypothetical protein